MPPSADHSSDPWYDSDEEPHRRGPGIVIRAEEFGPAPADELPDDAFAGQQDAILHMNGVLAEADAAAAAALDDRRARFFAEGGATDFAAGQRDLLKELRKTALRSAPGGVARDALGQAFDALAERHLRRAVSAEHEARVRARALGAERALGAYKSAALADPDGLPDRVADAEALLARMVEAGTDPQAAAERAGRFRHELGSAVLDSLAERDPAAALARLDNGSFDAVLDQVGKSSARERLVRLTEAATQAARDRAAFTRRSDELERVANRRATVRALEAGLRDGSMDQGHIARALYRGDVSEPDGERLRGRLSEFNEQRLRRTEALDRFDAVAKGEAIIEGDQWEPEVIDDWALRERRRGTPLSDVIEEAFGAAGLVPRTARDELRSLILSSSPDQRVLAGQELRALQKASPGAARQLLAALPRREARDLSLYSDYAHLTLPPERIGDLVAETREQPQGLAENRTTVIPDRNDPRSFLRIIEHDENNDGKPEKATIEIYHGSGTATRGPAPAGENLDGFLNGQGGIYRRRDLTEPWNTPWGPVPAEYYDIFMPPQGLIT